jgi:hypothetical protein
MWNKTKEYKVCGKCKKELPKTEEFFFKRTITEQNKTSIGVYESYRSTCKKCYNIVAKNKRVCKPKIDVDRTVCKKCNTKYEDVPKNFSKTFTRVDGSILYSRICKSCNKCTRKRQPATDKTKEYMRNWVAENKERIRESQRKYREKNRDAILTREKKKLK